MSEDDFLEAQYEDRFIADSDYEEYGYYDEEDPVDYSVDDFDQADLDDYVEDYYGNGGCE